MSNVLTTDHIKTFTLIQKTHWIPDDGTQFKNDSSEF